MKAVFVTRDCLLSCVPGTSPQGTDDWQLRPSVGEGMRSLADEKLFVIVLDPTPHPGPAGSVTSAAHESQRLADLVRGNGWHLDGILSCPHAPHDACGCWGTHPGFLYAAAAQLDLRLDECYLLCSQPSDVLLGLRVGCRPVLLLNGRDLGELFAGQQPEAGGFPVAKDFAAAADYVLVEEEATDAWGHTRQLEAVSKLDEPSPAGEMPPFSPELQLLSSVPGRRVLLAGIPQFSRSARQWLLVYMVGGVWLSLGVAYLLTHLYRQQRFPAFVWYLTLQFIPRPVRGLLFILSGVVLVAVSLRAFLRLVPASDKKD